MYDRMSGTCHCGYTKTMHLDSRTSGKLKKRSSHGGGGGDADLSKWNVKSDTSHIPTDAYGKLEFSGTGQKISDVSWFFIG